MRPCTEALKNKRAGGGGAAKAGATGHTNNKRYLILTYAAEYDRVHYPLPLLHEVGPTYKLTQVVFFFAQLTNHETAPFLG